MQCSAVVDIQVNCTHIWRNDSGLNAARYGNFIRVGGLVGGLRDKGHGLLHRAVRLPFPRKR